jgi:hypothetical protein
MQSIFRSTTDQQYIHALKENSKGIMNNILSSFPVHIIEGAHLV